MSETASSPAAAIDISTSGAAVPPPVDNAHVAPDCEKFPYPSEPITGVATSTSVASDHTYHRSTALAHALVVEAGKAASEVLATAEQFYKFIVGKL
jgi:hypothetical protein